MKAQIVRIGHSQGIRIPKRLLKKFPKGIEIEETPEGLLIRPARDPGGGEEVLLPSDPGSTENSLGDPDPDFDRCDWKW